MKNTICLICVAVSSLWFTFSIGIAWGFLSPLVFLIPTSLLMGGTVVGIAYLGEKRFSWAAKNPQSWKSSVLLIGMPMAYILVSRLSKLTVLIELIILLNLAYLLFIKTSKPHQAEKSDNQLGKIEKQMEQCC